MAETSIPDMAKSAALSSPGSVLQSTAAHKDTASVSATPDTGARQKADSLKPLQSTVIKKPDSLSATAPHADSAVAAQKQADQRLKLVKRTHVGRQQVVLAACMMVFVVAIMTLAQQWNPR